MVILFCIATISISRNDLKLNGATPVGLFNEIIQNLTKNLAANHNLASPNEPNRLNPRVTKIQNPRLIGKSMSQYKHPLKVNSSNEALAVNQLCATLNDHNIGIYFKYVTLTVCPFYQILPRKKDTKGRWNLQS